MNPFAHHMDMALEAAQLAAERGEVPVGAALTTASGRIIACEGNRTRELNDPTAHAEMLVIRKAAELLGSERLIDCALYVTLEPCPMCAAAISIARISKLVYGASDPKSGGVEQGARVFSHPQCHHAPEVIAGIGEAASGALLKEFFRARRKGG